MENKMNVAVVCDELLNPNYHAGFANSAFRFSEMLSKRGHKVILIAAKHPGQANLEFHRGLTIYRFRSLPIPKTGGQLRIALPTFREIKNLLLKEDIHILHVIIPTPTAVLAMKAAKSLGIKIVTHSHTQPENLTLNMPIIVWREKIDQLVYKFLVWLYQKADVVICPSKFAERLIKQYYPNLRTVVISNGIDLSKFKKMSPAPFFEKYRLEKKRHKILFVGRLHKEKQVATLLRAMQHVLKKAGNADLYIVGTGYLMAHLRKLSEELGIKENVNFFGRIPDVDLVMAYNACDIFVLPSIVELEGLVVLEAMACGKPIVIANSKNSASVDFVANNGFLFKPNDPQDLAQRILVLLRNTRLRKKMGRESCKKSKQYDINKSVSMLEKVYASLLKRPHPPKIRVF